MQKLSERYTIMYWVRSGARDNLVDSMGASLGPHLVIPGSPVPHPCHTNNALCHPWVVNLGRKNTCKSLDRLGKTLGKYFGKLGKTLGKFFERLGKTLGSLGMIAHGHDSRGKTLVFFNHVSWQECHNPLHWDVLLISQLTSPRDSSFTYH